MEHIKRTIVALRAGADNAIARAEEAEAKNQQYEQAILEKDQDITSLQRKLSILDADLEKAESKLAELKFAHEERETARTTNEGLLRNIQLLEEGLDAAERNVKETVEKLRQVDVKAEHFERQVQRVEQERDQWEKKFEALVMACTVLPPELVDAIMVQFRSDSKTLAILSLVCKAWLSSARRYLFQYVRLDIYSPKFRKAREHLFKLLNSHSSIIPFIHHLEIVGELDGVKWLNECLPQLVNFVGVSSLSLAQIPWKSLDTDSKETITRVFSPIVNLSLRHVHFNTFYQFAEFICAFPSLHTIVIKSVVWHAPPSLSVVLLPYSYLPYNLRNLDLQQCKIEDVFDWLLSFRKAPTIRTMYLHRITSGQTETIDRFLRATENTLERVSFRTTADSRLFHSLDLSCNTQLRFVHFDVRRPRVSDNEWIIRTLSQIVSDHMEEVSFSLFLEANLLDWDKLEMIFAQPHFCRLRKIQIYYVGMLPLFFIEVTNWFKLCLPECHARGILFCNVGLWDSS